jgi:hypothetical protein
MKGTPIENSGYGKKSNGKDKHRQSNEFISRNTIFTWRKNMAQEIEYLVRDKDGFYNLYLRNVN